MGATRVEPQRRITPRRALARIEDLGDSLPAIEQQIEGIESSIAYAEGKSHFVDVSDQQDYIEQLRKEQDK